MPQTIVPMIHVPDVRATVEWYISIGFRVRAINEEDGEMNWAALIYGNSEFMLSAGGKSSTAHRREVDLYLHVQSVDKLHDELKDRIPVVQVPYDAFYGMREFIIRDNNGFWITFGQPRMT
jgi:uncharacterized glyoxalase superfamily protein PhnB